MQFDLKKLNESATILNNINLKQYEPNYFTYIFTGLTVIIIMVIIMKTTQHQPMVQHPECTLALKLFPTLGITTVNDCSPPPGGVTI